MKRKVFSLFLLLSLMLSLCGCGGTVGEIADSVMDAAMTELKNQVTRVLEENKIQVVEVKTAFGKLNDSGSKYQFFIAALIKSDATAVPQSAANTLGKIFTETGLTPQNASTLENAHLIHKDITFMHSDFSAGGYYVIWGYAKDLTIQLPDFTTAPSDN